MLKKALHGYIFVALLLASHLRMATAQTVHIAATPSVCHDCISIRVGLPRVERGPAADIADNRFTEVQLPDGRFRGFDAHGDTRAIDGTYPWDMSGPARIVLTPGKPGSVDTCGQWIQHVELAGNTLLGFVHDEMACRYQVGQTHKSMSLATSNDYGLTWKDLGQVITGTDSPTPNKNTGEGDCTFLNGEDGYYYAYCGRPRDHATIALRAPISSPGPGKWMKYFQGAWTQPGLGGDATNLNVGMESGRPLSSSAARWTTSGETTLLGWQDNKNLGIYFSSNHTTFSGLREPLLALDAGTWSRPAPSELLAYVALLDAKTGGNQLSNSWMLVYMYVQPNEVFANRYLVFRNVDITVSNAPVSPQVGVQLGRWYNPALHDRWSTTAAVPPVNGSTYKLETTSGYLMTVANAGGKPTVELEDCVSQRPGHPDHLLAEKGFCAAHDYQRLRTAGWIFSKQQEQTVALYMCYSAQEHSHFASNQPDCEKLGAMEHLLGYALSQ